MCVSRTRCAHTSADSTAVSSVLMKSRSKLFARSCSATIVRVRSRVFARVCACAGACVRVRARVRGRSEAREAKARLIRQGLGFV